MISVKDALNDLDRQAREAEGRDRFVKRCLSCWQMSLDAVEAHMMPLFPKAASKTETDWKQVRQGLRVGVPEAQLDATAEKMTDVLHRYADESRRCQREDLDAIRGLLEVMAAAAVAARARSDGYGGSLEGVCNSLRRLVALDSLDELRIRLAAEASQLQESVRQMVRENQNSLAGMERDLQQFRTRLAEAETAAATDPLTKAANRREVERQIEERIRAGATFSVALFDLDFFKSINDRFGHDCGDQVLRQFAALLLEQARSGDLVARWGGDEFLVILNCGLSDGLRRSQSMLDRVNRRYEMQWQGKPVLLPVRASAGTVEYSAGESAADLFRRVDVVMYASKGRRG